jgi:hypothetical protein
MKITKVSHENNIAYTFEQIPKLKAQQQMKFLTTKLKYLILVAFFLATAASAQAWWLYYRGGW